MITAPKPEHEAQRLKALDSYEILDTLPEKAYDDITRIAAMICKRPIALISLIDETRQWFKSHHGLGVSETPREYAFCAHAILNPDQVFEIQDSRKDSRFHDNPLVTDHPDVIAYCGVPLISDEGYPLGTLCVIDHEPGSLTAEQMETLQALAKQVSTQLELRKKNRALQIANENVTKAFENLDQFTYRVAHDLKSPLRHLSLVTNILKEDYDPRLDQTGKQHLDSLNKLTDKLSRMIDSMLQASKLSSVNASEISTFSLQALLEEIILLISPEPLVSIHQPEGHTDIQAFRYGLQIILLNLISNAIKYNDKEAPVINIGFEASPKDYHFWIQDNGPGIPPDKKEIIFERFETLVKTDRYGEEGTGLGLSMVRDLVTRMKGRIELNTLPDQGATFHIFLPKPDLES